MKSSSHTVVAYLRSLVSRQGMAEDDDCELLRRFAQTRDGDAFAVLMRRHGPMVLNLARRISDDEQLAEDVFQAAFLLLTRKAHTIRRPESLPCWLHGVARRLALQGRRERQRRQQREAQIQPSSPPSPLDELTVREFLSVLDEELHQLPETYRAPLILCCLEGLSREEAAKRLGCSADALKGRLERGRQRLRLRLEKRGLTLPAVLGGTLLLAGMTSSIRADLAQATLQATRGAKVSPAVAALIQDFLRTLFVAKVKVLGAVVIALALAGAGMGMISLHPSAAKENAELPAAVNDKPMTANRRVDLYGDPLPEEAAMRLGTIQRRAVGMELAVTADGKSIIGARMALSLCIWDAVTGEVRRKREPPIRWGNTVLAPDGRWLALAWGDKKEPLVIWDVQTAKKVRVLRIEDRENIGPIAFSRDGKRIAAFAQLEAEKGGYDHLVRVWQLPDGKKIFSTEVHNNRPGHRLTFSPDGKRLLATFLSSSLDKGLYCWDIAGGRQAWLNEDIIGLESMVFTADGKILTSPWGQAVDLATGRTVKLEKPPPIRDKGGIIYTDMRWAMTPDGRTLLIPRSNGVLVWDMIHGKQRRMLESAGEDVVVMPDGKSIITNNGSLQRWDLATGKPLWPDTFALGHIGKVYAVAFSADGKRLASVSADGSVRLWDAATGRPLRVWRAHPPHRYFGATLVDITADGRWILSGDQDEGILKLWDASSEKMVRSIALPPGDERREGRRHLFHLRIRADGARAIGLFGGLGSTHETPPHFLATWDLKTGQLLTCHPVKGLPLGSVLGLRTLSAEGQLFLGNGNLVDAASGNKIAQLEGTLSQPCAFSRDGALVVGGSLRTVQKDGQAHKTADGLRVWESATGKTVAHLKSKPWTYQVAFHPNNRLLATNDDGIQLHDAVTGKMLTRRRMPKDVMSSAICFAFTPDGRRLATGMPDGTILLWDISLPPSKLQHLASKEIEALWADLADADAAKAWRAVWRLADGPNDALAFLRSRVKPCPTASANVMRKLLADLDSESFEVREAAVKRLKELGPQAEPALQAALNAKPSLEQRRRIEELLAAAPPPPTSEQLRQLRALIVLERIGAPEARRLLEAAAKGPPSARLTRQAQAALACLP